MIARQYIVKGQVQGVGFRYFTYRQAEELGIAGYVKNLPGGDVEIQAQGEDGRMEEFVRRVQSGPPLAVVEDLKVRELESLPYEDFTIQG